MAGIGFELRKILNKDTLFGVLRGYTYAGVISSGPWILSILGILLVGLFSNNLLYPGLYVTQFQVSVTYLIAGSLILTGPFQLAFTRFTSDRLFEEREDMVFSNYHAVLVVVNALALLIGFGFMIFSFQQESIAYRFLMLIAFVTVSNIWIAVIFLTSMKHYRPIVWMFFFSYAVVVLLALLLRHHGVEGLLCGFVVGQICLLLGMSFLIYRTYTGDRFITFEIFERRYMFPALWFIGLFYNMGIWADKFLFWYSPSTGDQVIGPLNASVIYDIPIFLAYLGIIPGMAVFLVRIETDFVEFYNAFYDAVRNGNSLSHIEKMRNQMVQTTRIGLFEIIKVQAIAALLLILLGSLILKLLEISELYLPLLYIDIVATSLQVVFLGILNIFFYLDRRREVFFLASLFVITNIIFTAFTIWLGPQFYGYGFAASLVISVMAALYLLDREFDRLEYQTYMLQVSK